MSSSPISRSSSIDLFPSPSPYLTESEGFSPNKLQFHGSEYDEVFPDRFLLRHPTPQPITRENVNAIDPITGCTGLIQIARTGSLYELSDIVGEIDFTANYTLKELEEATGIKFDKTHNCVLHHAIHCRNYDVAILLIELAALIEPHYETSDSTILRHADSYGRTPMWLAAWYGEPNLIAAFLETKICSYMSADLIHNLSILHLLAMRHDLKNISRLFKDRPEAIVRTKDKLGTYPDGYGSMPWERVQVRFPEILGERLLDNWPSKQETIDPNHPLHWIYHSARREWSPACNANKI